MNCDDDVLSPSATLITLLVYVYVAFCFCTLSGLTMFNTLFNDDVSGEATHPMLLVVIITISPGVILDTPAWREAKRRQFIRNPKGLSWCSRDSKAVLILVAL